MRPISGMLVHYYAICPRKVWLSVNGVWMEQESETVALGKLLDETAYRKERSHLMIHAFTPDDIPLIGNLDGANLKEGFVREIKRSASQEHAHLDQLKFYLWMLELSSVEKSEGQSYYGILSYPRSKQNTEVHLEQHDPARLQQIVKDITELIAQPVPPTKRPDRDFCKHCAYEELCYG